MVNGDKLEQHFSCPNCGWEGFRAEFEDNKDSCNDCKMIFEGDN
jgi:hypothetical protein